MKKRRELDALVNGKLGRRKKPVTKGQHELLRNDTDSSDLEEFSIPEKTVVRKRGPSRFCATCLTVCGFFLLISCMMAIGGLVWVHSEMKRDLDSLREKIDKKEGDSNIGSSENISKIQKQQSELVQIVRDIQDGDQGLRQLQSSLAKITQQLNKLNETTKELAKGVAEAPVLSSLPKKVEELSTSIAGMGSDIASLKGNVDDFKSQITSQVDLLNTKIKDIVAGEGSSVKSTTQSEVPPTPQPVDNSAATKALELYVSQQVEHFNTDLSLINSSLATIRLSSLQQQYNMEALQNETFQMGNRISLLELKPYQGGPVFKDEVDSIVSDVLQQIHNATVDQISAVSDQKLLSLSAAISNVSNHISMLHGQIDQLNSSTQEVADLKVSYSQHTDAIDQHIEDLNTHVDQVESRVEALETKVYATPTTPGGVEASEGVIDDSRSSNQENQDNPTPTVHSTYETPQPTQYTYHYDYGTPDADYVSNFGSNYDSSPGDFTNPPEDYSSGETKTSRGTGKLSQSQQKKRAKPTNTKPALPDQGFDDSKATEGETGQNKKRARRLVMDDDEVTEFLNSL